MCFIGNEDRIRFEGALFPWIVRPKLVIFTERDSIQSMWGSRPRSLRGGVGDDKVEHLRSLRYDRTVAVVRRF